MRRLLSLKGIFERVKSRLDVFHLGGVSYLQLVELGLQRLTFLVLAIVGFSYFFDLLVDPLELFSVIFDSKAHLLDFFQKVLDLFDFKI